MEICERERQHAIHKLAEKGYSELIYSVYGHTTDNQAKYIAHGNLGYDVTTKITDLIRWA